MQRNLETVQSQSGITPAFDGTVDSLLASMKNSGISISLVNNVILKPELMRKANDWTASAVARNDSLVGMGYIVAGAPESADEVQRCVETLHFKALKIHHSHSKILPNDSRNDPIYEKISELGVPVLFHCGKNPFTKNSAAQYSLPSGFRSVLASFPKMRTVLAHLAGYADSPREALDLLSDFPNGRGDTAVADISKVNFGEIVSKIGTGKLVFGSDFPIYDPKILLPALRASLSQVDFETISSENPAALFNLEK